MKISKRIIFFFLLISALSLNAEFNIQNLAINTTNDVLNDYLNFYSKENIFRLASVIGVAGVFANTSLDGNSQDYFQENIRKKSTDDFSKLIRDCGSGKITIPIYLAVTFGSEFAKETYFGSIINKWGKRTLRSYLVGVPVLLTFQRVLGGSRPYEFGSFWHLYNDDNAVSGHCFMGAIPFLSAAKMTDNIYLKSCFYFASTLTGLTRINDNKHFISQVILGWWIAYISSDAIDKTEFNKLHIIPSLIRENIGLSLNLNF
ncbi:MAG: phosphatase PAP2 family protein [Armatimonadetes bacterium]|nr:phosphatase PAP2 family protein [Armatimonadota bacterium]